MWTPSPLCSCSGKFRENWSFAESATSNQRRIEVVRDLLKAGAEVNIVTESDTRTALEVNMANHPNSVNQELVELLCVAGETVAGA